MDFKTLDALPGAGQTIKHKNTVFTTVKEGLAHILVPPAAATSLDPLEQGKGDIDPSTRQTVFYNPIQQFNRDLSVLAIRAYGEDLAAARTFQAQSLQAHRAEKRKAKKAKRQLQQIAEEPVRASDPAETTGSESGILKRKAITAFPQEIDAELPLKAAEEEHDVRNAVGAEGTADSTLSDMKNGSSTSEKIGTFKILDALSATGLRALRYAQEIPFVTRVTANDRSKEAVDSIAVNSRHNRIDQSIETHQGNAVAYMYGYAGLDESEKFEVIDLDPYGSAVSFLDAAINAVKDGGLLCVTCTDAGVWASCGYPEKTYALYGGLPLKGHHGHEGGLRLILHAIASAAAKQGIAIEPLLSLYIDYYARVFVRVQKSAAEVKFLASKTMLVFACDRGCGSWTVQPLARTEDYETKKGRVLKKHSLAQGPKCEPFCEHCGFKTHLSGPMWGGQLHNPRFLEKILSYLPSLDKSVYATLDRIEGMITTALEETELYQPVLKEDSERADGHAQRPVPPVHPATADRHPFFVIPSALSGVLHCKAPGEAPFKGALRHAGYKALRSHIKAGCIRTDAPQTFIWHLMREWIRQRAPLKEDALKERSSGYAIINKKDSNTEQVAKEKDNEAEGVGGPAGKTPGSSSKGRREVMFDEQLGKETSKKRLVRYQANPRANWGPMSRATG